MRAVDKAWRTYQMYSGPMEQIRDVLSSMKLRITANREREYDLENIVRDAFAAGYAEAEKRMITTTTTKENSDE